MSIQCNGFVFTGDFDSGNLAKVESVPVNSNSGSDSEEVDYEFNVWPHPDCAGTEFENGNRTWFYFGMKGGSLGNNVKLNIVNLNRQMKMFVEGMAPVFKCRSTRNQWERVRDKPSFKKIGTTFTLTFEHRLLSSKTFTYFAFTYPYAYSELQSDLLNIDTRFSQRKQQRKPSDIYYHRECVCYSLEGRRVDLLTISSHHNILNELEPRLPLLFPENTTSRPKKFLDKKVIFLSARVHPGETPSSFVMKGAINFLLTRDNVLAHLLRKMYVFKVIPMLNPDGVARGHYRTDSRGVNLNRFYTDPSPVYHPSVYAARCLIIYHHFGSEEALAHLVPDIETQDSDATLDQDSTEISNSEHPNSDDVDDCNIQCSNNAQCSTDSHLESSMCSDIDECSETECSQITIPLSWGDEQKPEKPGIFLYMDFHAHASKKGIFLYGNHFPNPADRVECMLLPKIMAINSPHFHFDGCNFTERIMYIRDRRDGMSREGAGRVAVTKITGLIQSYTLECNYNTGFLLNTVPPALKEPVTKRKSSNLVPPKYTPAIFEEFGKDLCISVLDMTNSNPYTRLANSEFRCLNGVRDCLRKIASREESALQYKRKTQALNERRKSMQKIQIIWA